MDSKKESILPGDQYSEHYNQINTDINNEDENESKTETDRTPNRKGFMGRKALAITSGVFVTVGLVGGAAYIKFGQKNQPSTEVEPTKTEQTTNTPSTIDNSVNQNNPTVDQKKTNKEKIVASYDPKKDPNVSYKDCPDPKADSCMIEYHDPNSGATLITAPNMGPEKAMNNVNTVVTGLDRFTEIGIQKPQREKLWKDFLEYGASKEKLIEEISVKIASIKKINTEPDDSRSIDFEIVTDRTVKLNAKIIYSGEYELELKIFNPEDNTLLYDSVK